MTATQRKDAIDAFLGPKIDKTKELLEKGNLTTARYMAMIIGMWMHTFKMTNTPPFESTKEGEAFFYCSEGYIASMDAMGITREMQEELAKEASKQRKADMAKLARELAAEQVREKAAKSSFGGAGKKDSIWTKKLF